MTTAETTNTKMVRFPMKQGFLRRLLLVFWVTMGAMPLILQTSPTQAQSSTKAARIHTFLSTGSRFDYSSDGWWRYPAWMGLNGGYNLDSVDNRMVAGDFDGDGISDVATFYDFGNGDTRIHTFLSTQRGFGAIGTQISDGYYFSRVGDRMVAGDFNGDGKDDIATFYDYDGGARIHMFLANGVTNTVKLNRLGVFNEQGTAGWWSATRYRLENIEGRMVAGDFNGDGKDDIATFYDYGGGKATIHVWVSTGNGFHAASGQAGWWQQQTVYYPNSKIADRMIAGDFDGDGDDDIATFYDYGNGKARLHVFLSTKTNFKRSNGSLGWWRVDSGYSLSFVDGRMVAGDFDKDGYDDIATFFDYGNGGARIHTFLSTGSSFDYNEKNSGSYGWWRTPSGYTLGKIDSRMVAGDFDGDNDDDIAVFFDYGDIGAQQSSVELLECDNPTADVRAFEDLGIRLMKKCYVEDNERYVSLVRLYYYPNGSQSGKYTHRYPLIVRIYIRSNGACPGGYSRLPVSSTILVECEKRFGVVDAFDTLYTQQMFDELFNQRQQACLTSGVECYVAPIGKMLEFRYGWSCGSGYGRGKDGELRTALYDTLNRLDTVDSLCYAHDTLSLESKKRNNDVNLNSAVYDLLHNAGTKVDLNPALLTAEARIAGEGILQEMPCFSCDKENHPDGVKGKAMNIEHELSANKLEMFRPPP